ncbi:predicted protein [Streptomyces sp. C]|nr:predicted protein [Streptomyces sp. C]
MAVPLGVTAVSARDAPALRGRGVAAVVVAVSLGMTARRAGAHGAGAGGRRGRHRTGDPRTAV